MINRSSGESSPLCILCTLGLRGVMTEIAPAIAKRGLGFEAAYASTNALMQRIDAGESADIALLIDSAIDQLTQQGKLMAGSRRDLARSAIGIAVRAGTEKPDIGTADAFKRALLAARSIGYSVSGASGIHFANVVERLGIAEQTKRKAKTQDGVIGELAARGEVEIAVQQVSELKLVQGIDIVGPLPRELQKTTVFSAGIFTAARHVETAKRLIAALAAPDVAAVIRRTGLEPVDALV